MTSTQSTSEAQPSSNSAAWIVELDDQLVDLLSAKRGNGMSKAEAYVYLLKHMARVSNLQKTAAGTTLRIGRGQLQVTITALAEAFCWTSKTVARFLRQLADSGHIRVEQLKRCSLISLNVRWSDPEPVVESTPTLSTPLAKDMSPAASAVYPLLLHGDF